MPFILAHDLGTTGDKATLFDDAGNLVLSHLENYSVAYPQANWAEEPDAQNAARYVELAPLFQETYHALEPVYAKRCPSF